MPDEGRLPSVGKRDLARAGGRALPLLPNHVFIRVSSVIRGWLQIGRVAFVMGLGQRVLLNHVSIRVIRAIRG
jgi:hypothetical protein